MNWFANFGLGTYLSCIMSSFCELYIFSRSMFIYEILNFHLIWASDDELPDEGSRVGHFFIKKVLDSLTICCKYCKPYIIYRRYETSFSISYSFILF